MDKTEKKTIEDVIKSLKSLIGSLDSQIETEKAKLEVKQIGKRK